MTRQNIYISNTAGQRGRDANDEVHELSFDDDATPPPRTGDPRILPGEADPEISPRRVREAGMTGGETGNSVTDDDLSPETLFDEEHVLANPADKSARVVGAEEIGGGTGLDEAELAQAEHPDRRDTPSEEDTNNVNVPKRPPEPGNINITRH
jgi:hypothetical protein